MLKDSMILTFSKGIRGILMLIFNMIVARLFSENIYGTYKHINLIVNMLSAICILGIPTTISYFYPNYDEEKKNKLIGNTIMILLSISIVTSLIIIMGKNYISVFLNNENILIYIYLIAIYSAIMIVSSFLENLYISSDNSVLLGKIYVTYTVTNFIIMILSLLVMRSLYFLILGIVIIEAIRSIVMFCFIVKKENVKLNIDIAMIKMQIKFALPLGVVALVQTINGYIDNLFISHQYTPDKYAAFANAATDIPLVGIVTVSIAAVALPKMSQIYQETKNEKLMLKIWGDSCIKTALIMYPIFWGVLLFGKGYIEIIFSERYVLESTPIFLVYLLKFPLYCTVFGNILIVLGKQKYIMKNSIIGIVLNIILNSIFIKLFGMIGPAMATVIVQYIVVYLQLKKIAITNKTAISRLLPYKNLIKVFFIPSLVAIPLFLIGSMFDMSNVTRIIIFAPVIYITSILIYCKFKYFDIEKIKQRKLFSV